MLGLGSLEAALAVWLCLAAALLCVVYGAVSWNKRGKPDTVRQEHTVVVRGRGAGREEKGADRKPGQGSGT